MSADYTSKRWSMNVERLTTGYGNKLVCSDISIDVSAGEIVAVIGHNGAGKSTLLKAMFGLLPVWSGSMRVNGRKFSGFPRENLVNFGGALVGQGARVFTDLTVRENLVVGGLANRNRGTTAAGLDLVNALFPVLDELMHRRAGTLSSGEKQIVALAAALVREPKCLMLDEPTLGLAPSAAGEVIKHIQELSEQKDLAVVMVEQKVREAISIASRIHVMRRGELAFSGSAEALKDEDTLRSVYF